VEWLAKLLRGIDLTKKLVSLVPQMVKHFLHRFKVSVHGFQERHEETIEAMVVWAGPYFEPITVALVAVMDHYTLKHYYKAKLRVKYIDWDNQQEFDDETFAYACPICGALAQRCSDSVYYGVCRACRVDNMVMSVDDLTTLQASIARNEPSEVPSESIPQAKPRQLMEARVSPTRSAGLL
jgi:alpha-D-ribose 1-methylphosphonate 5-triphosphate diphosphatase PhnM